MEASNTGSGSIRDCTHCDTMQHYDTPGQDSCEKSFGWKKCHNAALCHTGHKCCGEMAEVAGLYDTRAK